MSVFLCPPPASREGLGEGLSARASLGGTPSPNPSRKREGDA
jgi:hypothetical protein